jgi:hypothetical protein
MQERFEGLDCFLAGYTLTFFMIYTKLYVVHIHMHIQLKMCHVFLSSKNNNEIHDLPEIIVSKCTEKCVHQNFIYAQLSHVRECVGSR